jgi:hypothetical protein
VAVRRGRRIVAGERHIMISTTARACVEVIREIVERPMVDGPLSGDAGMAGGPVAVHVAQTGVDEGRRLPITERLLARLPGPRVVWLLIWGAVPVLSSLALPSIWEVSPAPGLSARLTSGVVYSYAVVLALWASRRFARDVEDAELVVDRLAEDSGEGTKPVFLGIDSTLGPLALLALTVGLAALVTAQVAEIRDGLAAALSAPVPIIVNLPLATAVWLYAVLLLGLNRLGRRRLLLDTFPQDPSLGLNEVGRLAFTAFAIYAAGFVPVLAVNLSSPIGLVINLAMFLAGVVIFFMSLSGLHRQLAAARKRYSEQARVLYALAYEPVRSGSLDALRTQAQLLAAAEGIERHAEAIQRWPFDDKRLAFIKGIAASTVAIVLAGLVSRLILNSLDV